MMLHNVTGGRKGGASCGSMLLVVLTVSVTAILLQLLHRLRVVLTAPGYSENDKSIHGANTDENM